MSKTGFVYIMSSQSSRLYVGVTSDLEGRVWEHKQGAFRGLHQDVQNKPTGLLRGLPDMLQAIAREKQLKGWTRAKKIALILEQNPAWEDRRLF